MRSILVIVAAMTMVILQSPSSAEAPASTRSTSGDILPFRPTESTLANGLKLIVVPTGFPNLVSVRIVVQAGSRNEVEPGKSGFAHFFEHLMFRGTPSHPPEKYQQIMKKAGARDNAGTGNDATVYYSTFANEDLDTILGLYADMFQNLSYPEADFKTEARAILGEYNKNSAEPLQKVFEVQRERFFQVHTYKHTTMGFIKDIENMPNEYEYSKLFFQRWYRPEFTTLVVAGDVTADRVQSIVTKYWGDWKTGTTKPAAIPKEPPPAGPMYAHVPWPAETLPIVTVGFLAPAFDENGTEPAAIDMLSAIYFGQTSDLYKKLVVAEQKVDQFQIDSPSSVDPSLLTIIARVKNPDDVVYVRDQILATAARAREELVEGRRLADTQSFNRYSLSRSIDSTERVAAVVAGYAQHRRSYDTVNRFFRTLDALTPADLRDVARTYFTDRGLIVTTLSKTPLPPGIDRAPALASLAPKSSADAGSKGAVSLLLQKAVLPQLNVKLLFAVGSAHDPAGKEGLAALTAAMMTLAGSRERSIDEINAALYPAAGSFTARADKEMTSLTGVIHRDHWKTFVDIALPQLTDPGWRPEDFERLKARQLNALVQDLRSNNEEELGKERLQINIFRGTPYAHTALGTVAGIGALTLADVKDFARRMYTRANLTVGISGDAPDETIRTIEAKLAVLPEAPAAPRTSVDVPPLSGVHVDIVEKDTRATAISFGFPIEVTRAHADFAALSVARAWFGEHRMSSGRLYQQIREIRGMNYGDYAYIEAFPRGMFQFFPDPNVGRRRQIFEIWIRPVVPANAHMALRIAVHELRNLVRDGLSKEDFEDTRDYLMKNVSVITARQDQQLGYALDSRWYGIGEFTEHLRSALQKLTVERVNAAIKQHLTADNLSVVMVTKDAASLREALVTDAFSPIKYDGEKPKALLDEDRVIGSMRLGIAPANVRITPVLEVFAH